MQSIYRDVHASPLRFIGVQLENVRLMDSVGGSKVMLTAVNAGAQVTATAVDVFEVKGVMDMFKKTIRDNAETND